MTKGASKEISIDCVILRAKATVIAIDADAPPKPAGVLHEIDESEYHELEGHAEFEKREEKREMATDTWYAPKLRPKRGTMVPAVAGAFTELSEVGDGKLHATVASQLASVALSAACITDKPTTRVDATLLQFI